MNNKQQMLNIRFAVPAARLTGVKNIVPIQKTGSYLVRIPVWNLELTASREVKRFHIPPQDVVLLRD